MARISQIGLHRLPAMNTLSIRKTIDFMREFSDLCGYAFGKIQAYLDSLNELPGGAPFACFHNMDLDALDVEIGFPVAGSLSGSDDIAAGTIPSQKVAFVIDFGSYMEQDPTLEELLAWVQKSGRKMKGTIYYQYLNDTGRPANEMLTLMMVPVE